MLHISLFSAWVRRAGLLWAASLLGVVACRPDADLTAPPAPGPTPYALVVPASLNTTPRVPADNPLTVEGVELGRFLFYEKLLSADNSISCASCHQQDKAFTDGRPFSQGVGGAFGRRSSMSLTNIMWVDSLNWDFRFSSIEAQNRHPLAHPDEMAQAISVGVSKLQNTPDYPGRFQKAFGTSVITEELLLKALGQFQRTLISGRSKFDLSRLPGSGVTLTADEEEGYRLFSTHPDPYTTLTDPVTGQPLLDPLGNPLTLRGGNCGDCHGSGGLFKQTLVTSANNGLDEFPADSGIGGRTRRPHDFARFGVPTLRNIALTAPYMHDGRFASLRDVLDHYNEHVQLASPTLSADMRSSNVQGGASLMLTPAEKRKIIAFLHTLTDTEFVTDPRFADPH